jgi:hypothetical protein
MTMLRPAAITPAAINHPTGLSAGDLHLLLALSVMGSMLAAPGEAKERLL